MGEKLPCLTTFQKYILSMQLFLNFRCQYILPKNNNMKFITFLFIIILFFGCTKTNSPQEIIPIPNGDFEYWSSGPELFNWQTNSCTICTKPIDEYVVKQDADASHGNFAAKFIYNYVYVAMATNKFSIPKHPSAMTGYVKIKMAGSDNTLIKIDLFKNSILIDSGNWTGTSSIANYTRIDIPITQLNSEADSALITIKGGKKPGTVFWIDNLSLIKK